MPAGCQFESDPRGLRTVDTESSGRRMVDHPKTAIQRWEMIKEKNSSYPGGKSGAGVYQRIINLIPPHKILIVPFAGHCGIVRNILPAEETIVIDRSEKVCQWWHDWSRSRKGRAIEIHHTDGIEYLRIAFGLTRYRSAKASDAGSSDMRSQDSGSRSTLPLISATSAGANQCCVDRETRQSAAEPGCAAFQLGTAATYGDMAKAFIFADPPYVMSERSTGRIYDFEMTDADHMRLIDVLTRIDAARYRVMVCGYSCNLYSPLRYWNSIDHRVPTRGGLQDETIWMNYHSSGVLHDYRYIGSGRRSRERIRRRQINWRKQLEAMEPAERAAMLAAITRD